VQALKIKDLEERNEALRQELQALKDERSQRHSDENDVMEHMQRDLRSKSSRIGELQRDLTETQKKLEEALSSKDQILTQQRELFKKQRESTAHELESLTNELNEVKVFQERRSVLEAELSELSKQVHALKTRHEVQVSDMKREFGQAASSSYTLPVPAPSPSCIPYLIPGCLLLLFVFVLIILLTADLMFMFVAQYAPGVYMRIHVSPVHVTSQ
jgi:small-conductance mechanosensitive channel